MMTAVEWLQQQVILETNLPLNLENVLVFNKLIEQAKEIEKEQRGYSEEEVRLAYFQGEKDSYVKGGQTKEMEDEFIQSLKQTKQQEQ
jgi:hypothetical protein